MRTKLTRSWHPWQVATRLSVALIAATLVMTACQPAAQSATPTPAATQSSAATATPQPQVIKIGILYGLTGAFASTAEQWRNGINLEIDRIQAKLAAQGLQFQLIYEDHQGNPTTALTAFTKLANVDQVSATLIGLGSPQVLVTLPMAEQKGILICQVGANSPKLVNASPMLVNFGQTGVAEIGVALDYAYKQMNIRNLATIAINNDFGTPLNDLAVARWNGLGGKVVDQEKYEATATDFSAIVAKIRVAKPDAVYLSVSGASLAQLIKQAREGGITVPFLSNIALEVPELLTLPAEAVKDVYWTSVHWDPAEPSSSSFFQRYQAKYGKDPIVFAAVQADALDVVASAAIAVKGQGKQITGTTLRDEILKTKTYNGIAGQMSFPPDGNTTRLLDLRQVKSGKFDVYVNANDLVKLGILKF